jgi:hypothetical protein
MNVHDRQDVEPDVSGVPEHRFRKLSERLWVLQQRGGLTFAQWSLATWLTCAVDPPHPSVDRDASHPDRADQLEADGAATSQRPVRAARQGLVRLRDDGAVEKAVVITLTGLLVPASPERVSKASANETGVSRLHTEGARLQSESGATPLGEPLSSADGRSRLHSAPLYLLFSKGRKANALRRREPWNRRVKTTLLEKRPPQSTLLKRAGKKNSTARPRRMTTRSSLRWRKCGHSGAVKPER